MEILPVILVVRQDHNVRARPQLCPWDRQAHQIGNKNDSMLTLLDLRSVIPISRYLCYELVALLCPGDQDATILIILALRQFGVGVRCIAVLQHLTLPGWYRSTAQL